jgi:hypothetical protein
MNAFSGNVSINIWKAFPLGSNVRGEPIFGNSKSLGVGIGPIERVALCGSKYRGFRIGVKEISSNRIQTH